MSRLDPPGQIETSDCSASSTAKDVTAEAEALGTFQLDEIDVKAPNEGTKEILQRWLSVKSTISPTTLGAIKEQDAPANDDATRQMFRSIGKGFCAEIFVEPDIGKVFKRAYRPQDLQLWNDFTKHLLIRDAIHPAITCRPDIRLSVPTLYEYYTRDDIIWWDRNRNKWPKQGLKEATDLIGMEHISPLLEVVRDALIERYCPVQRRDIARTDPENRDCLIRIYLGLRRRSMTAPTEKFSLRNFEADLSILDDVIPDKNHHATAMAVALACMHWDAKVDGADVEFVLGAAPEKHTLTASEIAAFPPRTRSLYMKTRLRRVVHLWLLDFNQVGTITMDDDGVTKALSAFWQNDPYFPRPESINPDDGALWQVFREAYLDQSNRIYNPGQRKLSLALKFVKGVEEEAEKRGRGPPMKGGGGSLRAGPTRQGPPRRGEGRGRGGKRRERMTGVPELDV